MFKDLIYDRRHFLGTAVVTLTAVELGILGLGGILPNRSVTINLPHIQGELGSLDSVTGRLNSQPLTATSLKGKVVLINFWTYTCINWLRSLPYVRAWSEKYKDAGLVIIGVHAPEFAFEQSGDNVQKAAVGMNVKYPVALDNNYAIWRSFKNQYWPALYFLDAKGNLRHH